MTYMFAPYQLAEIAMDIEDSGVVYYSELAKRTTDEGVKKLFLFLSEQEVQHKRSFEMVMEQSKKTEDEGEYVVDLYSQMKTIATDIKKNIEFFLTQNKIDFQVLDAIDIGIQTETKSIEAYMLMKNQLIDIFATILDSILVQEQQHLTTLTELKSKYLSLPS